MPVVNAYPSGSGRTIEQSAEGRKIVRPWTVLVSDLSDDEQVAANAPQLPADGSGLPSDPTMIVKRKRGRARNQYFFDVDVEYGGRGTLQNPNPTSNATTYRWSSVEVTERVDIDLDGKPYVNTAAMPFDGGSERVIADQVLHVQRYLDVSQFDAKRQRKFKRASNSDKFLHADPGQCLITSIEGTFVKEGIISYWDVTGSVQFKDPDDYPFIAPARLWHDRKINEGFEEYLGPIALPSPPFPPGITVPTWRPILDSNGNRITRPALLKYQGDPNDWPINPALQTLRLGIPSPSNPIQIIYRRRFKLEQYSSLALLNGIPAGV